MESVFSNFGFTINIIPIKQANVLINLDFVSVSLLIKCIIN